jgi:Uma2 family endonuclease
MSSTAIYPKFKVKNPFNGKINIPINKLTYEDYYNLDDGIRYELFNGELIMSPAPLSSHQNFSGNIYYDLRTFCKLKKLGKVFYSPIDVILDKFNTVQPDIVFISNENKGIIKDRGIFGSPDMVIEILSPSTAVYDRNAKKDLYEKFGIKEYWIVDLANKIVEVFLSNKGKFELSAYGTESDKVKSVIIEGFEADLMTLFLDE